MQFAPTIRKDTNGHDVLCPYKHKRKHRPAVNPKSSTKLFHVEQQPKKSSRLTDNITSDFFAASSKMQRSGKVMVYVEGYEDIAFWRSVLDEWETPDRRFEISTPIRGDMAKGKKVVLNFAPQAGDSLILCVDSDFDYLLGNYNEQSRTVNANKYVIQTYAYAIENLLCYPPSLNSIAVKATKNDMRIFDFEYFMREYSKVIYPLFLWYLYAAVSNNQGVLPLSEFRNAVRISYLDLTDDGDKTLKWIERQVQKRLRILTAKHKDRISQVEQMEKILAKKGVKPETTHIYMQGHTLMDHVVKVVLSTVCDTLRKIWVDRIMESDRTGLTLKNELSYYNNSLRDIDTLLLDNTLYRASEQFEMITSDLTNIFNNVKK